jgi:hypothetical protein
LHGDVKKGRTFMFICLTALGRIETQYFHLHVTPIEPLSRLVQNIVLSVYEDNPTFMKEEKLDWVLAALRWATQYDPVVFEHSCRPWIHHRRLDRAAYAKRPEHKLETEAMAIEYS